MSVPLHLGNSSLKPVSNVMVGKLAMYKTNVIIYIKFGLVLWHIIHYRLFNAKSIFININRFYFKLIKFSISTQF